MKRKKRLVAEYERMKPEELREATKPFDEEMVVDKSRPLSAAERKVWNGTPEARSASQGGRREGHLGQCGARSARPLRRLGQGTGVSRASLIERGLRAVLEAGDRCPD